MKRKALILTLSLALLALAASGLAAQGQQHFDEELFKQLISKDTNPVIAVFMFLIPITAISGGTVLLIFAIKWWHQRRMLMIEKGMAQQSVLNLRLHTLLAGVICLAVGTGISIQQAILQLSPRGGVVLLCLGVGLLVFRALIGRKES